jgi:hypothetical protein
VRAGESEWGKLESRIIMPGGTLKGDERFPFPSPPMTQKKHGLSCPEVCLEEL